MHHTLDDEYLRWQLKLLSDWYALRKTGFLRPLLCVQDRLYTFSDPLNPWGSRGPISLTWTALEADVNECHSVRDHLRSQQPEARRTGVSDRPGVETLGRLES